MPRDVKKRGSVGAERRGGSDHHDRHHHRDHGGRDRGFRSLSLSLFLPPPPLSFIPSTSRFHHDSVNDDGLQGGRAQKTDLGQPEEDERREKMQQLNEWEEKKRRSLLKRTAYFSKACMMGSYA